MRERDKDREIDKQREGEREMGNREMNDSLQWLCDFVGIYFGTSTSQASKHARTGGGGGGGINAP